MSVNQIALVSLTDQLTASDLSKTASALQKQIIRDIGPIWNINATIDSFPDLNSVPTGYWIINIVEPETITDPRFEGFHLSDTNNQPYALVKNDSSWQLTCSHEMCEMLVDPSGNKMVAGDSIQEDQGRVNYLVEVCDPSESADFAYTINGIMMSDFYTPAYFDPIKNPSVRYSFTGAITEPKQVLKGGYLSWNDPVGNRWYRADYYSDSLQITDITDEIQNQQGAFRSRIDRVTKNPDKHKNFEAAYLHHQKRNEQLALSDKAYQQNFIKEISKYITLK